MLYSGGTPMTTTACRLNRWQLEGKKLAQRSPVMPGEHRAKTRTQMCAVKWETGRRPPGHCLKLYQPEPQGTGRAESSVLNEYDHPLAHCPKSLGHPIQIRDKWRCIPQNKAQHRGLGPTQAAMRVRQAL